MMTQTVRADGVDPTNLPKPIVMPCGGEPCYGTGDHVCDKDLVCVRAKDGRDYCATPDRVDACAAHPTTLACCGYVTTQSDPASMVSKPAPTTTTVPTAPAKTTPPQKTN